MNQHLKQLHTNVGQRETLKLYMIEILKELTVEKAFAGEDVTGIAEARKLVDRFFEKLDEDYGEEKPVVISNSR